MTLGIKHAHVIGKAVLVLIFCKVQSFLRLIPPRFQGILPDLILADSRHRRADFSGRLQYRILILCLCFFFLLGLHVHVSPERPAIEERECDLRHDAKSTASCREQSSCSKRCEPQYAQDGNFRLHLSLCLISLCNLRGPCAFSGIDIRPLPQHVGRNCIIQCRIDVRKRLWCHEHGIECARRRSCKDGNL